MYRYGQRNASYFLRCVKIHSSRVGRPEHSFCRICPTCSNVGTARLKSRATVNSNRRRTSVWISNCLTVFARSSIRIHSVVLRSATFYALDRLALSEADLAAMKQQETNSLATSTAEAQCP